MTRPPRIQKFPYRRECRQPALHEILMRRHPAEDLFLFGSCIQRSANSSL